MTKTNSYYCVCFEEECICHIMRVSKYNGKDNTYLQNVYVNNVLLDTIDLNKHPKYKPDFINHPQKVSEHPRISNKYIQKKYKKKSKTIAKNIINKIIHKAIQTFKKKKIIKPKIIKPKLTKKEKRRLYVLKNKNKYHCKICKYGTHDLSIYKQHLLSKKHHRLAFSRSS